MTSLGPGSVVKGRGGGRGGGREKTGSNRKNIGERSKPSNGPFTLPKLAFFFF